MLSIRTRILEHQQRLSQIPFLRRLECGVARAEDGQQFAADLTFWVMTFQDILRLNRARVQQKALKEIADQHLQEDAGHEQWFWHDARVLSALRAPDWYFGRESARVRELSFELASEVFRAQSDEARVALILTLEATGKEFFPRVVAYFERCDLGRELKYFAQTHREVERDHEVFEAKVHDVLAQIELSGEQRDEATALVDRTFAAFSELGNFLERRLIDRGGKEGEGGVAQFVRNVSTRGIPLRLGAAAEPFGVDFGGLTRAPVAAVVDVRGESDVAYALEVANATDVKLSVRGGGNSQAGQSIPAHGLSLHVASMKEVSVNPQARTATCGPGATWRDLMDLSLKDDLVPYVVPLNLDLPIGGTLAAGGLGSSSHKYGTAADHVSELRAINGQGEVVSGTRESRRELFDAVLANQGRCAVTTRIGLRLRGAGRRVQTFGFRYEDLNDLLHDMRSLVRNDSPDHMEAFTSGSFLGMRRTGETYSPLRRWAFTLYVSYERDADIDASNLKASLRAKEMLVAESSDPKTYAARYDARFHFMRASGGWQQAHPWLEWLLPSENAVELIAFVLERIPQAFGDGHRLFCLPGGAAYPCFFARPDGDELVGLAVLPTGIPKENLTQVLDAAAVIDRQLIDRGARRYLSGWLGNPDAAYWRQHYGDRYDAWSELKKQWDPNGVLQSRLFSALDRESPSQAGD